MGEVSEFSTAIRLFLKAYRWRTIDPVPWAPLRKPLRESRVALISSAGFHRPDQDPFDESKLGGDSTFREISADTDVSTLLNSHRSESFDHRPMIDDPNLAFPIDRLNELVMRGRVGASASFHLSFMGSITAPGRLVGRTAPEAVARLVEAEVDVALLVPV